MRLEFLEILNCPFCGFQLRLQKDSMLEMQDDEVSQGILVCQCCAYPVVAGIPYIRTGNAAEKAMNFLGKGEKEQALYTLLDLDEERQQKFKDLFADKQAITFRKALEILCTDAEGFYLFYRFSDPTYLSSQAVLGAIGQNPHYFDRYVLDLCGGSGHFTRSFSSFTNAEKVILADVSFWKIWLAKQFIAPDCQPICFNANEPLPFAKKMFSLVFCSDAFHYIWSKRLLAGEMLRLIGNDGVAILSHLHNALCENPSAGMPLTPAGYKNLFEEIDVRLFKEDAILDAFLNKDSIDLSVEFSEDELKDAPALLLITTQKANIFRLYEKSATKQTLGQLVVNPLYCFEDSMEKNVLQLQFPSSYYETEFADSLRYLPENVELNDKQVESIKKGKIDSTIISLVESYVLLDVPSSYL